MRRLTRVGVIAGLALAMLPGYASAQTADNQTFTIIKTAPGPSPAFARGVVNAVGTESSDRDPAHPGAPFHSTFTFPGGDLSTVVTPGRPQVSVNPTTCLTQIAETDGFLVIGGSGMYAAASGSGTSTVRVTAIAGRSSDGGCLGPEATPLFELVVIQGTGSLSLN